jgi:Phosphotransferase enzyme family
MLRKVRLDMLTEAAHHNVNLILTGLFNATLETSNAWRTVLELVEAHAGSALFIRLTFEREELLRRVQQEDLRTLGAHERIAGALRHVLTRPVRSAFESGHHPRCSIRSSNSNYPAPRHPCRMSATFPSQTVRTAVARALGRPALESEITLRPSTAHQSNRLYDVYVQGVHLIAKEYLRADRPEAAHHEYAALRHVESLQLAPEPVFFSRSVGPVVVYRYMEGNMWDRRVPLARELRDLAELWLRFHELETGGLWMSTGQATPWPGIVARLRAPLVAYARWADGRSSQSRAAARLCLEALERCVTAAAPLMASGTPPLCFCQSDARFANVIARPDGRLRLVDWEDSGLRDPAREVADLFMHPNQEDLLDFAAWQPFLSLYVDGRRHDSEFERRLQGCLTLFPVFWLGILLADGLRRITAVEFETWRINEMEPNTRLRRYLARAQAWPDPDPNTVLAKLGDVAFF